MASVKNKYRGTTKYVHVLASRTRSRRPIPRAGSPVTCSRSPIYVSTIPILAFTMTDPDVHVALIFVFTFE
jgi:hypothetical protein